MPTSPGISREMIRHPLDQQAEDVLRSVPGFDLAARKFVEFMVERPQTVYLLGNSIQVGPRQYATIYQQFRQGVSALDIHPEPMLFVIQNPAVNSYSLGEEHPCVVLTTGLLDVLTEAEIGTVLAHELGHIKCGHTTLIQMAIWAMGTTAMIGEMTLGLGNLISSGLIFAFYEWRRKAELSADRAALLVTQDIALVLQSMMRLAGGSRQFGNEVSLQEFERQAEDYRQLDEEELNQLYKFLVYNGAQGMMLSHPFPVERLQYLKQWAMSEEYQQILAGQYGQSEEGSDMTSSETVLEVDRLRQELHDIQQEIERLRG